ncbi:Cell division protein FtsI/penicillin-binding protein 2 [Geodermatophilus africanus]|uniref:Cell division protein FtsI/penicillin-binding protein 2 n=1 Tax=Geodermatophilus africanus TaxID=1137993 RepID=A0A1H3F884_9ACTN|nr:penicillin-binding transpeptidase domain-containing protein [Geodermatophilus africanus]SDX87067.1 Cell division protein FtsI/penicillin-binding protein 2 [Geodermatophilus africanus]
MRTRRGTVLGSTFTLLAVPVLAACSGNAEDDVRAAAEAFLGDWAAGDTAAAAGATTDPEVATALLEQTATDLPGAALTPEVGQVTVEDGTATVDWTATWDLAAAPEWSYPATLRLQEAEEGWDVVPEPALVHRELGEGQRLLLERELPERAAITDAAGQPLFARTEVVNVGVDPAQVTDLPALAASLSSATGIAAEEIVADVQAAPAGQFVPVITLRRPDFEAVRAQVFDLPGAVFPTDTRLLAPSPRFASALLGRVGPATAEVLEETTADDGVPAYATGDQLGLSGLQRALQEQLTGTPGFTVSVVSTDESTGVAGREVDAVAPVPGEPVQTPLVRAVQTAADAAVATQQLPTHLVVVRPGTGEILAVSSNEAAAAGNALTGQYPPGSSMKTISATALLATGTLTPQTPVACPGTFVVDGREFENADQFDLGTVPFTEAFARSCNTTFMEQGLQLPDDALAGAAASYGVGTDWQLPVDVFSGEVPVDSTGTTKAANAIGQGQVLMSPAQLALVAAGVAGGTPAVPVEVVGAESAGQVPAGPDPAVLEALRPMMREVVLSGTANGLADRGEVYGKTGTAEFGGNTPPDAHGWFMGYQLGGPQGDLAFAVLVETGQSSSVAVDVTDVFLGGLGG